MGLNQLKQFTEMTPTLRKGCKPNSVYWAKSCRVENNCNSNWGNWSNYQCFREGWANFWDCRNRTKVVQNGTFCK